jgi:hypothetical protein
VRVGEGSHRYDCLHDWGRLPDKIQYGLTHGIAVDRRDHVHVLHTSTADSPCKDTVVVFDPQGRFVRSWGAEFEGSAHGFDLVEQDGQEILYITDQKRGLFKTTLDGKILWHVEKPDFYRGKDLRYSPSNVAVAPNGDVYLSDGYGSYFIHRFDRRGRYLKTFGGPAEPGAAPGRTPGRSIHPHGLFVDTRGKEPLLVVAENDQSGKGRPGRLQAFDLDGGHHSFWDVTVRSPRHFAREGGLVAVPDLDARVTLVDERNKVVAQLGDGFTTLREIRALRLQPRDQFLPGKFVCPHDAAFDSKGNLFISEWVTVGRITKLQKV